MKNGTTRGGLGAAIAFGLGAAVMYFLDPGRGARRRALVRDKSVHLLHKTGDAAESTGRDLRNRARGLVAEVRGRFKHETVENEVLVERVRAAMGRTVSHPGALEVAADAGVIMLGGPILADEAADLLSTVKSVRGVRDVVDGLDRREHVADVVRLQGNGAASIGG